MFYELEDGWVVNLKMIEMLGYSEFYESYRLRVAGHAFDISEKDYNEIKFRALKGEIK